MQNAATLDVAKNQLGMRNKKRHHYACNGGLTMCGGRDFDKILLNEFVVPWLEENYFLPEDLPVSGFKVLSAKFFPNS